MLLRQGMVIFSLHISVNHDIEAPSLMAFSPRVSLHFCEYLTHLFLLPIKALTSDLVL